MQYHREFSTSESMTHTGNVPHRDLVEPVILQVVALSDQLSSLKVFHRLFRHPSISELN